MQRINGESLSLVLEFVFLVVISCSFRAIYSSPLRSHPVFDEFYISEAPVFNPTVPGNMVHQPQYGAGVGLK